MNGDIKIRFGMYKGEKLKDLPESYLRWLIKEKILKGRAMNFAKKKTNYPKSKYRVTVEDSVDGDGEYFVEAYSEINAMDICKSKFNIQCTQSYHGTSFKAELIN